MQIIFGSHPFEPRQPDPGFATEFEAARASGQEAHVISMESLFEERNPQRAVRWIPPQPGGTVALFRGWMLTLSAYEQLYLALKAVGVLLINNPTQYATCHFLPESYPFVLGRTPRSVWFEINGEMRDEQLREALASFASRSVVVKDYVKSQKHYWSTACFIPDASDFEMAKAVVGELIRLQGTTLNRGLVIREFVALESAGTHGKSGMPLSREVRVFYLHGKRMLCSDYWNAGIELPSSPELAEFDAVASQIPSNFFTMDLAKTKAGQWIAMELGDGQVAGLPDGLEPSVFYSSLRNSVT